MGKVGWWVLIGRDEVSTNQINPVGIFNDGSKQFYASKSWFIHLIYFYKKGVSKLFERSVYGLSCQPFQSQPSTDYFLNILQNNSNCNFVDGVQIYICICLMLI